MTDRRTKAEPTTPVRGRQQVTNAALCAHRAALIKEDLKKHFEQWPDAADHELAPVSDALQSVLIMLDVIWERRRHNQIMRAHCS
jgi:hypothetical protein